MSTDASTRGAPKNKERSSLTGKADFTPEEWQSVLQGPATAGMIVVTAQRGGTAGFGVDESAMSRS